MTHTLQPATPSRDGNALVALTVLLILTTWSFFGRFSLVAAAAGVATAAWLHWWNLRHPPSGAGGPAGRTRYLSTPFDLINISAVHVGGDAAGLAFVIGTVVVFVMSLPPLRWFALASAVLAVLFATTVVAWHRTHSVWSAKTTSVVGP